MGQANSINCCNKDDKNGDQIDMESEMKKDKKKRKGKDIKILKKKISKQQEKQRAEGLELLKKKTSKLRQNAERGISKKSTMTMDIKPIDEKDPDTFIPVVPPMEDLEDDEDLHNTLSDERKKAIYYWYEAHDEDGWEKFEEDEGVSMHYYGTDYENEFYIKRCMEVERDFREVCDVFYALYASRASAKNPSKVQKLLYDSIEMSVIENKTKKAKKKAGGKKYTTFSSKYECRNNDVIIINHDTEQDYSPEIKSIKGVTNGITLLKKTNDNKTYIMNVQVLNLSGKIDPSMVKQILRRHFESVKTVKKELEVDEEGESEN